MFFIKGNSNYVNMEYLCLLFIWLTFSNPILLFYFTSLSISVFHGNYGVFHIFLIVLKFFSYSEFFKFIFIRYYCLTIFSCISKLVYSFTEAIVLLAFLGCGKKFCLNFCVMPSLFQYSFPLAILFWFFFKFLCNAPQRMSGISWPRYLEKFPPRSACFVAFSAICTPGLFGQFFVNLRVCCKLRFSHSGFAFGLHESALYWHSSL